MFMAFDVISVPQFLKKVGDYVEKNTNYHSYNYFHEPDNKV